MIYNKSTKELLVESATELFSKYPVDKVSITNITKTVGLAVGLFIITLKISMT